MSSKTCLIITGPTAAGKTALAIELARHFDTAIISADSRQCFRELNIGVAKPSPEQLQVVKHYFINTHSIEEEVNAAVFEAYALEAAAEIFRHRDVAVMAGGTGLYIKAFCEGMDAIPVIDPAVREAIISGYAENGPGWLREQIAARDPLYFTRGEIQNPQRLMRALEVVLSTGKSIYSFHTKEKKKRDFHILKAGITLPRQELYDRINGRVDEMIREGLIDEVKALWPFREYNALQTVGYTELFRYLEGAVTREEAIGSIRQNTRRYAKRQMTWFRKDSDIRWFPPGDPAPVLQWYLNETKR